MTDPDLDALLRDWDDDDHISFGLIRPLIQRLREVEARSVPIEPGDVELFGTDPYRSAWSWHDAWMKSEARIAQLERVREAAQNISGPEIWGLEELEAALAALEEPVKL